MTDKSDPPADEGTPRDGTDPYRVGYGNPPKHTQVKPGQVLNQSRKRRGRSVKNDIRDMLAMTVPFGPPNQQKKVSTRQAAFFKLREKALKGDARALERLIELAIEYEVDEHADSATRPLVEEDRAILAACRQRDLEMIRGPEPTANEVAAPTPDTDKKES